MREHPGQWSIILGVLVTLMVAGRAQNAVLGAGVGTAVGLLNFAFWRSGVAPRLRERLLERDRERFGDKSEWTTAESVSAHPLFFIGLTLIILLSLALILVAG